MPDVQCDTDRETVKASTEKVVRAILNFYKGEI